MPRGDNIANLRTLSSQAARELGSKGGKARAANIRKQKDIKNAVNYILSQRIGASRFLDDNSLLKQFDLCDEDRATVLAAAAIISGTIAGSAQMAKLLLELTNAGNIKRPMPAKIEITFEDNSEKTNV